MRDNDRPTRLWFQESHEGLILFIVFYTQACRWSRCIGCGLTSTGSQFPIGYKSILKQIDFVFADPEIQKRRNIIRKVIVSNNGSVLDQKTFSSMALMYLIIQLNLHLPNLSVLSLETRVEYIEVEELEFLARGIKEGDTPTDLELAIGFEAFDDNIRNNVMKKGLTKKLFENLLDSMSQRRFRLKCYLMQKPVPGITDEEAVKDIQNAIEYFTALSLKHINKKGEPLIRINVHLNPTYAARGTILEKAFAAGEYSPPTLRDTARAALAAEKLPLTVFIGLNDEGLAVPGGSFIRDEDRMTIEKIEMFNRTQNYDILRSLL